MGKYLFYLIAFLVICSPFSIKAGECKNHIELHSAANLANEYGRDEMWVIQNVKINTWEKPTHLGKGKRVGQMSPGSRAMIIEISGDDFQVQSPLDNSIGWINKLQVAKTLFQDSETFEPCTPSP